MPPMLRSRSHGRPAPMWSLSESGAYCVRTKTLVMPELAQFDSVKSMMRYLPPKGTAGLARTPRGARGAHPRHRRGRRPGCGSRRDATPRLGHLALLPGAPAPRSPRTKVLPPHDPSARAVHGSVSIASGSRSSQPLPGLRGAPISRPRRPNGRQTCPCLPWSCACACCTFTALRLAAALSSWPWSSTSGSTSAEPGLRQGLVAVHRLPARLTAGLREHHALRRHPAPDDPARASGAPVTPLPRPKRAVARTKRSS